MGDNGGNGHKKTKEEAVAEAMAEVEAVKKRCGDNLKAFTVWVESLEECQLEAIKSELGDMSAYFMSESPFNIILIFNPKMLLDIISLMMYAFWQGMEVKETEKGKGR